MGSSGGKFLNSEIAQQEEAQVQEQDQTVEAYIAELEAIVKSQVIEIARLRAALRIQENE